MKLFSKGKDGGPYSTVTGYWLIEWKRLFSIVLLKFDGASREAYHDHAFNSVSWLLKGFLKEHNKIGWHRGPTQECSIDCPKYYPSLRPIITKRSTFHQVDSLGTSWVLSFRGPWTKTWNEVTKDGAQTLTNGRKVVNV